MSDLAMAQDSSNKTANVQHYQDIFRVKPLIGFKLGPVDQEKDGNNFQDCNGDRYKLDLSRLTQVGFTCTNIVPALLFSFENAYSNSSVGDETTFGVTGIYSKNFENQPEIVTNYERAGEVAAIYKKPNGGIGAVIQWANLPPSSIAGETIAFEDSSVSYLSIGNGLKFQNNYSETDFSLILQEMENLIVESASELNGAQIKVSGCSANVKEGLEWDGQLTSRGSSVASSLCIQLGGQ